MKKIYGLIEMKTFKEDEQIEIFKTIGLIKNTQLI